MSDGTYTAKQIAELQRDAFCRGHSHGWTFATHPMDLAAEEVRRRSFEVYPDPPREKKKVRCQRKISSFELTRFGDDGENGGFVQFRPPGTGNALLYLFDRELDVLNEMRQVAPDGFEEVSA